MLLKKQRFGFINFQRYYCLIKQKDLNKEIEPVITLDENLSAPIALGQKVGTITYNIEGIEYSADLLASHEVKNLVYYFILFKLF